MKGRLEMCFFEVGAFFFLRAGILAAAPLVGEEWRMAEMRRIREGRQALQALTSRVGRGSFRW